MRLVLNQNQNQNKDIIDVKIHIDEARALAIAITKLVGIRILKPELVKDLDMDLIMRGMAKITYSDKSERLYKDMRHDALHAMKSMLDKGENE